MKFSKLGVFALFTSLASALDLGLVDGGSVGIGAPINLNVALGDTSPGCYAFVLCNGDLVVGLLDTIDVLTDDVVSLLLPGDLEPGRYTVGCCPLDDYKKRLAETKPFDCE